MNKTNKRLSKCYDSILLIQLRNGLRISEAIRSYIQYLKEKKIELQVPLSKKKKPETRLVVIPSNDIVLCPELAEVSFTKLKHRVIKYCEKTYKVNTHSLRYSFITYLLKAGVSPAIVAKITKHSKLDFILDYTQEKTAEEILKNM